MGRRNETNRLAHKKKIDQKKEKDKNAQISKDQKLKEIINRYNSQKKS